MSDEPLRMDRRTWLALVGLAAGDVACAGVLGRRPSSPRSYTDGPDFEIIPYDPATHQLTEEDKAAIRDQIASQNYDEELQGLWIAPDLGELKRLGLLRPATPDNEHHVDDVTYRLWVDKGSSGFHGWSDAEVQGFLGWAKGHIDDSIRLNRKLLDCPLPRLDLVFEHFDRGTNNSTIRNTSSIVMNTRLWRARYEGGTNPSPMFRHELFHVANYLTDRYHATTGTRQEPHPARTKFVRELAGVCWEYSSLFFKEEVGPGILSQQVMVDKAKNGVKYMKRKSIPVRGDLWKRVTTEGRKGQDMLNRDFGLYLAGVVIDNAMQQCQGDEAKAREMVLLYNQAFLHLYAPEIDGWHALNARFGIHDQAGHIVTYRSTMDMFRHEMHTPMITGKTS